MLDLRPQWLDTVRRLVAQHLPGAEVLAYGSRVLGTAHSASDLDLVARNPSDPREPLSGMEDLREALSESDLPILVDLHDWARIPESFRTMIEEHFEVIQAGSGQGIVPTPDPHCET